MWSEVKPAKKEFCPKIRKKQERPYLPNVGGEVGEKVAKGSVVGADHQLDEDAAHYTPQPSESEETKYHPPPDLTLLPATLTLILSNPLNPFPDLPSQIT